MDKNGRAVAVGRDVGRGGLGLGWSRVRGRIGSYAGATVLVLLFGRQGWFLWNQARIAVAWLIAAPRPVWRDLHLGDLIALLHVD